MAYINGKQILFSPKIIFDGGYDEGFKDGQLNVLENAECLKGSLSGEVVAASDVSPIEHNLKVNLTSNTITDFTGVEVSRCGKNLATINKVDFPFSGYKTVWEGKITGDFVVSWKHNLTDIGNTSSGLLRWHFADGTNDVSNAIGHNILYKKINGTITKIEVLNWCDAKGGSVYDIQLEVGTTQTDFEPFIEPQTAAADENGIVEGLTSVSPNLTLTTDTSGVSINCNYYKDIDKAFEELTTNIALSGGN